MSRGWPGGSTRAWRKTRARVLARDGHRCRAHPEGWCDRAHAQPHHCTGQATHAHHTHGRARTGDDERYIIAACAACNHAIGEPVDQADPPNQPVTQW